MGRYKAFSVAGPLGKSQAMGQLLIRLGAFAGLVLLRSGCAGDVLVVMVVLATKATA